MKTIKMIALAIAVVLLTTIIFVITVPPAASAANDFTVDLSKAPATLGASVTLDGITFAFNGWTRGTAASAASSDPWIRSSNATTGRGTFTMTVPAGIVLKSITARVQRDEEWGCVSWDIFTISSNVVGNKTIGPNFYVNVSGETGWQYAANVPSTVTITIANTAGYVGINNLVFGDAASTGEIGTNQIGTMPPANSDTTKYIAFTFDDGPSTGRGALGWSVSNAVIDVLDMLKKHNAKATYFLVGDCVNDQSKAAVQRMIDEGHEIGSHSKNHPYMSTGGAGGGPLTVSQVQEQVNAGQNKMKDMFGYEMKYFRIPFYDDYQKGSYTVRKTINMPLFRSVNYGHADESVTGNITNVSNAIINGAQNGDIILLHDVYSTTGAIVDNVVAGLQAKGFVFVTMSEMFHIKNVTPGNGVTYENFRNLPNINRLGEEPQPTTTASTTTNAITTDVTTEITTGTTTGICWDGHVYEKHIDIDTGEILFKGAKMIGGCGIDFPANYPVSFDSKSFDSYEYVGYKLVFGTYLNSEYSEMFDGTNAVFNAMQYDGVEFYYSSTITGTTTVAPPEKGDINGDGKVNGMDLLLMKQHILNVTGKEIEPDTPAFFAADMNDDGKINGMDLLLLKKKILL